MRINFVGEIWAGAHIIGENYFNKDLPPGSAKWATNGEKISALIFTCPCGCGEISAASITPPSDKGWQWNGHRELPTLTPSLQRTTGCRWHGYLTNGEFKTA